MRKSLVLSRLPYTSGSITVSEMSFNIDFDITFEQRNKEESLLIPQSL